MPNKKIYLKHLFATFVFSAILLNIIFYFYGYLKSVVENPKSYINTSLSTFDLQFAFVFISLVVISVLISFVFYLILTLNSRSELIVWEKIKPLVFSKEQFQKLYEASPIPYVILDKDGDIEKPNKATLRFFGVVPNEIEGKNLFSYFSEENKDKAEKFFQYYKSNISFDREEVQMVTKSGKVKFVMLSVFEMKDPETGKNAGIASIFDITEQKILDKAKTEFLSLASHQLRTPLATTKWYTEMLISGDLGDMTPKQKEYIDRLYIANENMIELVDVLLNVTRIETGKLSVEIEPTNVPELSESILSELYPQIVKKKLNVNKAYNNLFVDIKSDPKLLRIVIQNLISNSVKYTPEGGTISIVFEQFGDEKRIIVSDTGVGIPKDDESKIFTKLFRSDNVRKLEGSQGTGLGLYLVKSIVEGMGGRITFTSEENKGSIFTITI